MKVGLFADSHLNKELGALDIDDQRYRIVHSHATGTVSFSDKGGQTPTARIPHGQVNHHVKVVLLQVVHDVSLLVLVGAVTFLFERPVYSHYLKVNQVNVMSLIQ